MIVFLDKTFCIDTEKECGVKDCPMCITPELEEAAFKIGLPISYSSFNKTPECSKGM